MERHSQSAGNMQPATSPTCVMMAPKLPVTNMTVVLTSGAAVYAPLSLMQQDATLNCPSQRWHLTLSWLQCCPIIPDSGHPEGSLPVRTQVTP